MRLEKGLGTRLPELYTTTCAEDRREGGREGASEGGSEGGREQGRREKG